MASIGTRRLENESDCRLLSGALVLFVPCVLVLIPCQYNEFSSDWHAVLATESICHGELLHRRQRNKVSAILLLTDGQDWDSVSARWSNPFNMWLWLRGIRGLN